ncbi:MAG: hypothetical protein P8Y92_14365 [Halioglobus sp.]
MSAKRSPTAAWMRVGEGGITGTSDRAMPAECAPQTACVPGSEIIPGQGRNKTLDSFRRPFRNPHHSASGGDELLPLRL